MNLRVGQQVRVTFRPRARSGDGARVIPGSVYWRTANRSIATITPDPTNALSVLVLGREPGVVLVSVVADLEDAGTAQGAAAVIVYEGANGHGSELSFGTPENSPNA